MKQGSIICALACLFGAGPAAATTLQFFEGNDCTQRALGSLDTSRNKPSTHEKLFFVGPLIEHWNDEARSVRIMSNWRGVSEVRAFDYLVYDSKVGEETDDWVRIIVRDVMLIPVEGVCIGSFEKPFDRHGIFLERHLVNGLDGKVSTMRFECDVKCFAVKTYIPAELKRMIGSRRRP